VPVPDPDPVFTGVTTFDESIIRDLLRKRGHLVKLRTSLIISLQNIIDRNCGTRIKVNDIKRLRARATYHVLKEQTPFMPEKLFAS